MRILDRYIIRKFLGTFFFAIALLILIIIIFDISEKFDEFLSNQAPVRDILLKYYANFIPFFVNQFAALFTFIAVIWFTSRMAANTEIVAILSSGISFRRVMVPYLLGAISIGMLSFVLANFIIPETNKIKLAFEAEYIENTVRSKGRDIHIPIEKGITAYVESFSDRTNIANKFSIEKMEGGELVSKLNSRYATFDTLSGKWHLQEYFLREINGDKEYIEHGFSMDTLIRLGPEDFKVNIRNMETMGFTRLREFIREELERGTETVKYYQVEKHRRLAYPFSTIVLTLIGMALSSRKQRGGIGIHLVFGLSLAFSYIFLTKVTETFAINGNVPAGLAVWMTNIFYMGIAIYLIIKAPK
jgi:lipopolysaccharide export system permease protein